MSESLVLKRVFMDEADIEAIWQAFLGTDHGRKATPEYLLQLRLELKARCGKEYTVVRTAWVDAVTALACSHRKLSVDLSALFLPEECPSAQQGGEHVP